MSTHPSRRERGAATAEYAVGTIGACAVGLALLHLVDDVWFLEHLRELFGTGLSWLPLPELPLTELPMRIGGIVS